MLAVSTVWNAARDGGLVPAIRRLQRALDDNAVIGTEPDITALRSNYFVDLCPASLTPSLPSSGDATSLTVALWLAGHADNEGFEDGDQYP